MSNKNNSKRGRKPVQLTTVAETQTMPLISENKLSEELPETNELESEFHDEILLTEDAPSKKVPSKKQNVRESDTYLNYMASLQGLHPASLQVAKQHVNLTIHSIKEGSHEGMGSLELWQAVLEDMG